MAQDETKIPKERSPLYPAYSINECIDFVKEINRIGGKKVAITMIASAFNVSPYTNSFKSKISASKQFGLIQGSSGVVQLSSKAKRLIYETDEKDVASIKIDCFLTAPLYKKLVDRYENQAVPPADKLSNVLLLEYEITKAAKDIAASKFIESAQQIGILQNGVLVLESFDNLSADSDDNDTNDNNELAGDLAEGTRRNRIEPGYHFEIPTLSGAVAQITIPKDVTVKDLDFISMYLQTMLPKFITNLIDEIQE